MKPEKVYCKDCVYMHFMIYPEGTWCDSPDNFGENWYGKNERLSWVACSIKNEYNDCKDYKQE